MKAFLSARNTLLLPKLFQIMKSFAERPEYGSEARFKQFVALCKKGGDVNARDRRGFTLLHYCAWGKSSMANQIASFLISQGAHPDAKNEQGAAPINLLPLPYEEWTPFWQRNFLEYGGRDAIPLAEALCESGANLDHQDQRGHTALYAAIEKEETALTAKLIQLGAKLPDRMDVRCSLKKLFYETKTPPLHFAIVRENSELIRLLLDAGADINQTDDLGLTPLGLAASLSIPRPDIIFLLLYLIERGADVRVKDSQGMNILLSYAQNLFPGKMADLARYCIEKDVDLEARDGQNRTILGHVARLGDVRTAKLLIDAKIDLDAVQDREGLTALETIASIPPLNTGANGIGKWQDLCAVADLLLQAGAVLSQSALDLAREKGNDRLLSVFQKHG